MSSFNSQLSSYLLNRYTKYMNLKIYVDTTDRELVNKYLQAINEHNLKISNNIDHIDAGFDLFCPENKNFVLK